MPWRAPSHASPSASGARLAPCHAPLSASGALLAPSKASLSAASGARLASSSAASNACAWLCSKARAYRAKENKAVRARCRVACKWYQGDQRRSCTRLVAPPLPRRIATRCARPHLGLRRRRGALHARKHATDRASAHLARRALCGGLEH